MYVDRRRLFRRGVYIIKPDEEKKMEYVGKQILEKLFKYKQSIQNLNGDKISDYKRDYALVISEDTKRDEDFSKDSSAFINYRYLKDNIENLKFLTVINYEIDEEHAKIMKE